MMPVGYDVIWSIAVVTHLVLLLVALRRWFTDQPVGLAGLVGAVIIVAVPLVGPLAYLLSRRPVRRAPAAQSDA